MLDHAATPDTSSPSPDPTPAEFRQTAAILVEDPVNRRLLEGVIANLELKCTVLHLGALASGSLHGFEMLIADEPVARALRPLINIEQDASQQIRPALIAVVPSCCQPTPEHQDGTFDSVLILPERPALVTAQLSVALYAHRAFALRYQSALEELSLNRNIFKSVTSGISVANARLPDLPLMYVNPAFEVMTGYSLEEVEGKNCRFLQAGDTTQPGLTLIREALAGKRETVAILRNVRKDGTPFWNELAISPIRNAAGELTHFVGIQMDVTERVEFEIALRESEKLAAVGRLASSIAHEINNPLEAVMNLLYLARETMPRLPETQEASQYLNQADLEVQRIKLITAQSLRFYKQSHGPGAIFAHELFESTLDVYSSKIINYGVTVESRQRSTEHIVCLVSEIRQVLSNLVANAIDAMMSTSGGRLLVRTREATDWTTSRNGVVFTIADTGAGMSPETLANLYKAFFTTKGAAGNGLGLWISAEIIQRHHGRLHVRTRQGTPLGGTVFRLFLPFQGVSGPGGPAAAE